MTGTIVSYTSGTGALVVNVTSVVGTGTFTSWTISPPEVAGYELNEPTNTSNTDVTVVTSSYDNIAKLYRSSVLQDRVLSATITQCSFVFQESTTSVTSLTIGTGSQTLTVGANLGYISGLQMTISNGSNSMTGLITSYTPATGVLVVNVTITAGSGTFTSWTVIPTNHTNRMKLVSLANQNLTLVVLEFMSSIALNSAVQAAGTSVADAVILGILQGSWDSYANLIVA